MAQKGKLARQQVCIRFSEEELRDLARCQQILGGLSQSDTVRLLVRMFLGKIPAFPKQTKAKKS